MLVLDKTFKENLVVNGSKDGAVVIVRYSYKYHVFALESVTIVDFIDEHPVWYP